MINEIKELMTKITQTEWEGHWQVDKDNIQIGSKIRTIYYNPVGFAHAYIEAPHDETLPITIYLDKSKESTKPRKRLQTIIGACGCCDGICGDNFYDLQLVVNAKKYINYLLKKLNEKSN